jgi:cobalt/nickel transport system ATP-binding protein
VGLVFQNPEVQLFNPTVFDEVAFAPLQLRWPKSKLWASLGGARSLQIGQLQAGRRTGFRAARRSEWRSPRSGARSEVLLLDEPTAGLDPRSRSQIIDMRSPGRWRADRDPSHDLGLVEDIMITAWCFTKGKLRPKVSRRSYCAIRRS